MTLFQNLSDVLIRGRNQKTPQIGYKNVIIMSADFWLLHITIGKPQVSLCKKRFGPVTRRAHSQCVCKQSHPPSAIYFQDGS